VIFERRSLIFEMSVAPISSSLLRAKLDILCGIEIVSKETSLISEFVGSCVAFDRESAK
jgi:hypothetical protein